MYVFFASICLWNQCHLSKLYLKNFIITTKHVVKFSIKYIKLNIRYLVVTVVMFVINISINYIY